MTMDISNSAIGSRIREIRKIKGLTLEQLAECSEISANFLWEIAELFIDTVRCCRVKDTEEENKTEKE